MLLVSMRPSLPPPCRADYYYELGVQVVEGCLTSRPFTGGLMELSLLHKYVQVRSTERYGAVRWCRYRSRWPQRRRSRGGRA